MDESVRQWATASPDRRSIPTAISSSDDGYLKILRDGTGNLSIDGFAGLPAMSGYSSNSNVAFPMSSSYPVYAIIDGEQTALSTYSQVQALDDGTLVCTNYAISSNGVAIVGSGRKYGGYIYGSFIGLYLYNTSTGTVLGTDRTIMFISCLVIATGGTNYFAYPRVNYAMKLDF